MFGLLFSLLVGAHAAPTTNPEYLHQAPEGTLELTGVLSYATSTAKYKSGNKSDTKGFREVLLFEGGLNDLASAGVALGYHSLKNTSSAPNTSSTTSSGLEDLDVFLHARSNMVNGSFRYGLDVNLAVEKDKREANGDTNAATGGIALQPFVGYEIQTGAATVGGRLAYAFWVGDRKAEITNSSGTTISYTLSGGNSLTPSVFLETPLQETTTLGFAFEMAFSDKSKYEVNGTSGDYTSSRSRWNLMTYVPVDVTSTIRIVPRVAYGQFSAFDTSSLDSQDMWTIDLGARFVF